MFFFKSFAFYLFRLNSGGQLAQGDSNPRYVPTMINLPLGRVDLVPAGYHHSLYVSGFSLYGSGENQYGQLGVGNSQYNFNTPVFISSGNISLIGAGSYHSFFMNSSGLYGFGYNNNAQLGLGYVSKSPYLVDVPSQVSALNGISLAQITAGHGHSLFLTTTGIVFVCGNYGNGALGLPFSSSDPYQVTPIQNTYLTGVTMTSCGHSYSVVANYSVVLSFGIGGAALGQGPNYVDTALLLPMQIQTLTNITAIAAGFSHTLVLTRNSDDQGVVYAFGKNSIYGEL